MELASLSAVMRRIENIESKVGMRRSVPGGMSFQAMLGEEMKSGRAAARRETPPSARPEPVGGKAPSAKAAPSSVPAARAASGQGSYLDMIRAAAERHGVDPKLLTAVAEVESGLDQSAVSEAGAVGVMQLMPDTAASLGVDPFDAAQNIEGGARYLKEMLGLFDGDIRKAVAAYNAGPGAVRGYGGVPPYGETVSYVNSVLDLYR